MKIIQIPRNGRIVVAVQSSGVTYNIASCRDSAEASATISGVFKGLSSVAFVDMIKRFPVMVRRVMPSGDVYFN